jgi:hypothetical protein
MPMFTVNVNALEPAALRVVSPATSPPRESADSAAATAAPPDDGRAPIANRLELVAA